MTSTSPTFSFHSHFHSPLFAVLVAASLVGGCAALEDDEALDRDPFGYAADPKADEPTIVACGDDECSALLCGLDCSTAGEECVPGCAAEDSRDQVFTAVDISGDVVTHVDSRERDSSGFEIFLYGCEHWDYSNQLYDGLDIKYSESRGTSNRQYGRQWFVYLQPFEGPGSYIAHEAYYSESSAAHDAGNYYVGKDVCTVEVDSDGAGGILGSFRCDVVPHASGVGSVAFEGEFACGMNAVDRPQLEWF